MTESYLTTDIIVVIVLVVVLVLVGVCAFLIHFYWTKIGVSEIWNTAKWSSMRSSFYRTLRRLSRSSTSKLTGEKPYSGEFIDSEDIDGVISPHQLQYQRSNPIITSYLRSSDVSTTNININKPEPTQPYDKRMPQGYATKIGQPIENTTIYNIHEYNNNKYNDPSTLVQKQRF